MSYEIKGDRIERTANFLFFCQDRAISTLVGKVGQSYLLDTDQHKRMDDCKGPFMVVKETITTPHFDVAGFNGCGEGSLLEEGPIFGREYSSTDVVRWEHEEEALHIAGSDTTIAWIVKGLDGTFLQVMLRSSQEYIIHCEIDPTAVKRLLLVGNRAVIMTGSGFDIYSPSDQVESPTVVKNKGIMAPTVGPHFVGFIKDMVLKFTTALSEYSVPIGDLQVTSVAVCEGEKKFAMAFEGTGEIAVWGLDSQREIEKYTIASTDGAIGALHYAEDKQLYAVLDTGQIAKMRPKSSPVDQTRWPLFLAVGLLLVGGGLALWKLTKAR
ncbi:MAG: hypothetical protein AB7F31_00560 [Parachlamydiales bacterium]